MRHRDSLLERSRTRLSETASCASLSWLLWSTTLAHLASSSHEAIFDLRGALADDPGPSNQSINRPKPKETTVRATHARVPGLHVTLFVLKPMHPCTFDCFSNACLSSGLSHHSKLGLLSATLHCARTVNIPVYLMPDRRRFSHLAHLERGLSLPHSSSACCRSAFPYSTSAFPYITAHSTAPRLFHHTDIGPVPFNIHARSGRRSSCSSRDLAASRLPSIIR